MENIAVITGDLISSTAAPGAAVDRAMEALRHAANQLTTWTMADTRFTRFRGDGWQLYLAKPSFALRAALFLIAYLRAADLGLATRISVSIGPYQTLGQVGLSGASGIAFTQSGRVLDNMPKAARMGFNSNGEEFFWQAALLDLASWQANRWTREQATAMALALDPIGPTQDQIAKSLGITRQAVQVRLKGAGLSALQSALFAFEIKENTAK